MNDKIKEILEMITNKGFKAYVVGGYVRDYLRKIKTNDIDICTNARVKDLMEIFKDYKVTPLEYGNILLETKDYLYEITTFRKDIDYINNRKPIIEYVDTLEEDMKLKEVVDVLDEEPIFKLEDLELVNWMKNRYLCTYIDCINLIYPKGYKVNNYKVVSLSDEVLNLNENEFTDLLSSLDDIQKYIISKINISKGKLKTEKLKKIPNINYILDKMSKKNIINLKWEYKNHKNEKNLCYISLSIEADEVDDYLKKNKINLGAKQKEIVNFLKNNDRVEINDLIDILKVSKQSILSLQNKNLIDIKLEDYYRNPENAYTLEQKEIYLNEEQKNACNKVISEMFDQNKKPYMLHGVTGSGKTEVYMEIIDYALSQGLDSIVLVPEIALTPQTITRFKNRFGDIVGVFHSQLSEGQKHDVYKAIKSGNIRILIGARSALFAPFNSLGVIIIDEFHHASAPSYQKLLSYFTPKVLLGLTATPERMDGKDVLEYFDGRISSEMRLGEAIDKKLLTPFQYFCVTDELDLSKIKWSKGGYDNKELTNILTVDKLNAKKRADLILKSIDDYIADIDEVVGLGFCVSIDHANFMANYFNEKGIPSVAISSKCSIDERDEAKYGLVNGKYKFAFVVDLYNEGVDIPEINTILFLRPTDSLTVFLQQLGRGLRLSDNKECLTVLDYVGQAHKNYNFYEKFSAISKKKGKALKEEIESGFITLPKGCHLHMEKQAKEYILRNINSFINNKTTITNKIKTFEIESGKKLSLANFIEFYNITLKEIYKTKNSFYRLCVNAKVKEDFNDIDEQSLAGGMLRLINTDSIRLLKFWINTLENYKEDKTISFNDSEEKMLLMLHYTLYTKSPKDLGINSIYEFLERLYRENSVLKYDECYNRRNVPE